jgi:hypothetical protein
MSDDNHRHLLGDGTYVKVGLGCIILTVEKKRDEFCAGHVMYKMIRHKINYGDGGVDHDM